MDNTYFGLILSNPLLKDSEEKLQILIIVWKSPGKF